MVRRFAVLLIVALVGLGVPIASADAHPPDPVCNTTTSPDGVPPGAVEIDADVKLHDDLACDLWLFAPLRGSITVNLNGHAIDGVEDVGNGTIRILNGTVKSTIQVQIGIVLKRVHVMGDVRRGFSFPSIEIHNSTVDGSVVTEDGGATIDHSVIGNGITLFDTGGVITHNLIIGGIQIDSIEFPDTLGLIADNTIVGANGPGIEIGDALEVYAFTIRHNTITGSTGDGIRVISSCQPPFCQESPPSHAPYDPITIRGNRTVGNGGHGVEVTLAGLSPSHVVDGGKNVASGNALDPQCVGVICKS
jgi:hypothetical protein